MPRGQKTCKVCGTHAGPRAYCCLNEKCKAPFTMKGVISSPEKIEQVRLRRMGIDPNKPEELEEEYLNVDDFLYEVEPLPYELKSSGKEVECYMSHDNIFRLRKSEEFMGVPLEKLHDRWYTLLKKNEERDSNVVWQLVRRFKSMNSVLHFLRAVQRGEREVTIFKPWDNARKSRALKRFHKKQAKLKR